MWGGREESEGRHGNSDEMFSWKEAETISLLTSLCSDVINWKGESET